MTDPISGMGGGAAKIALQQMQQMQQMQQTQQPQQTQQSGGASQFQQVMEAQQNAQPQGVTEVQQTQQVEKTRSIRETAKVQDSQKVHGPDKTQNTRFNKATALQPKDTDSMKGLSNLMEGMASRKKDLDGLMKQAMKGKAFNQRELLVLQYKVSTYSLEMDLTSKVVEKSTGGIKQAMNTQV